MGSGRTPRRRRRLRRTVVSVAAATITDKGRLRVAVMGPDGALYLATDADPGLILRVVPA